MNEVTADAGSFRDFRGRVYLDGDRVLRTVMPAAAADFDFVRSTGLVDELVAAGRLVAETTVDAATLGDAAAGAACVIEHPKLPYVSYPYEWSFGQLKAAALLHLEVQLAALERDVALTDASAYNVQFVGARPLFIDSLSFRRYRDREFWQGHRQFCEQFVNPLLLRALLGVPHNAWYRGALEGIAAESLAPLLKWRHRLSWQVLTNVILQARLQRSSQTDDARIAKAERRGLPKIGFEQMLRGLRRWLGKLEPRDGDGSVWSDYARDNSYEDAEARAKREFVAAFVESAGPATLWDIGCNTGDYAAVALEAGAGYVVGFDFDQGALEQAYARAQEADMNFLPLYLDAANPSPSQGWLQAERPGFSERGRADAVIALALVHHLAIAKNIPLPQVIDWLIDMAPAGVIEFVPKGDAMVQQLLRLRDDHFETYDERHFEECIRRRADIVESRIVSASGRTLYRFQRH